MMLMAQSAADAQEDGPELPILGSRSGGLCYELVVGGDGEFVLLNEGRLSRVYLCRIAFGSGNEVVPFALKIQSDSYFVPGQTLANPDIDDAWSREREDLGRASSANIGHSLPLPETTSLPVVFCRRVERYFHPVCPETGSLLTVCKDDEFLRDSGLSEYSKSLRRYLYGGGKKRLTKTFYHRRGGAESGRADVTVGDENDLIRAWGPLARGDSGASAPTAPLAFACAGCKHVAECYPTAPGGGAPPAASHLMWVSFYDFEMIALGLLDLKYDEACDLVGGEDWVKIFERVSLDVAGSGRKARLAGLTSAFVSPNQWMFRDDPDKFGLEVLRLKLMMFSEVLEGVLVIHSKCDRPHFGITPNNLMAKVLPGNIGLPARWNLRVQVIDLGSPLRLRARDGEGAGAAEILQPGGDLTNDAAARHYVSPMVTERQDATMSMVVTSQTKNEGFVDIGIEAHAQGAVGGLRQFRKDDMVLVMPVSAGRGASSFWARIDLISAGKIQLVASLPAGFDPLEWESQRSLIATLQFYKNYGHPVDHYGLGMLLLRTLLVTDSQDMDRVEQWVSRCLNQFAAEVGTGNNSDGNLVRARLARIVTGSDSQCICDPANVLYKAVDRARAKVVPKDIWDDLIVFAFRLLTQTPGFSFAHSHSRGSPFLLKQVIADLQSFLQRLQVETFSADLRSREVSQVCSDVIMVLQKGILAGPVGESDAVPQGRNTGFMLHLGDADSGVAPMAFGPFDQPEITIGRRKDCSVQLTSSDKELIMAVSSRHATIMRSSAGWLLRDSSQNGTMLDSIAVQRDVPHELSTGAIIRIPASTDRAFVLRFDPQEERADQTQVISRDVRIHDRVMALYAKSISLSSEDRRQVLWQELMSARGQMSDSALLCKLEDIRRRCGAVVQPSTTADPELFGKAHRMLAQLARELLGPHGLSSVEDVEGFVRLLNKFVTKSGAWLVKAIGLRHQFDEGFSSTGVSESTAMITHVQEEGEVYRHTLDWTNGYLRDGGGERWLGEAFDRIYTMLIGGLRGVNNMLDEVRNELDPTKIEALARTNGAGVLTSVAASTKLWKLYCEAFHNVLDQSFVVRVLEPAMRRSYAPKS